MKIAVCIVGAPRTWKYCANSLFKLLQLYDKDIFLHISDHEDNIKEYFDLLQIYKPKRYIFGTKNHSKYLPLIKYSDRGDAAKLNTFQQYYGYKLMNDIMEDQYDNYDIIFRVRYDLIYNQYIDKHLVNMAIKNKYVFIPSVHNWGGKNDQFAFGNKYAMKKYFQIYPWIIKNLNHNYFNPEILLYEYLKHLNIKTYHYDLDYKILRPEYIKNANNYKSIKALNPFKEILPRGKYNINYHMLGVHE